MTAVTAVAVRGNMTEDNTTVYWKQRPISELQEGEYIEDVFVVKIKKNLFQYMNDQKHGFELILSDHSGKTVGYKFWGGEQPELVQRLFASVQNDDVVWVRGKVQRFKNRLEIASNYPEEFRVLQTDQYRVEDFIQPPVQDPDKMFGDMMDYVSQVEDQSIRSLLQHIFADESFAGRFKQHPAAIEIHHNRIGGLVEHVLEMLQIVDTCSQLFSGLDRDLLIAGAILHDIGKLDEIVMTNRIKGSEEGQLVGHITLGCTLVAQKMDELGIEGPLRHKLLHLIASHQGSPQFGSAQEPKIPEAFALYYADELSSKVSEILSFVKEAQEETEDPTMFHKRHKRNIYLH